MVGNYPCKELMALVAGFSKHSGIPGAELQRLFGDWMMQSFGRNFPQFLAGRQGSFGMLEAIEGDIHVEVRKLYRDADLPTFDTRRPEPDVLEMTYTSPRPLTDFRQGLIESCTERFGEAAKITRANRDTADLTITDFRIRLGEAG